MRGSFSLELQDSSADIGNTVLATDVFPWILPDILGNICERQILSYCKYLKHKKLDFIIIQLTAFFLNFEVILSGQTNSDFLTTFNEVEIYKKRM